MTNNSSEHVRSLLAALLLDKWLKKYRLHMLPIKKPPKMLLTEEWKIYMTAGGISHRILEDAPDFPYDMFRYLLEGKDYTSETN